MEAVCHCGCQSESNPALDELAMVRQIDEIIREYRGEPGSLIQVLHKIQVAFGYLPQLAQVRVAEELGVPLSEVYGVATFYAFFSLKPKGRHIVSICMGTACYVRGGARVLERLQKELGIGVGDTTEDGKFSLEVVRCLGACGLGPVITVNDDVFARLKPDRVPQVLSRFE